jgi:hypothetical protein
LIVELRKQEVEEEEMRSMCTLIKDVVDLPMTEETARLPNSRRVIAEAVRTAADKYMHVPGSDDRSPRGHSNVPG